MRGSIVRYGFHTSNDGAVDESRGYQQAAFSNGIEKLRAKNENGLWAASSNSVSESDVRS